MPVGAGGAWRRMRVNCFGHLGDGNLHYNLFPARAATGDTTLRGDLSDLIHETGGARRLVLGRAWRRTAEDRGTGPLGDPARLAAMGRSRRRWTRWDHEPGRCCSGNSGPARRWFRLRPAGGSR